MSFAIDAADDRGQTARRPVQPAEAGLPAKPLTVREGTFDDEATGVVYRVEEGTSSDRRLVRQFRSDRPLSVMAETAPPIVHPSIPDRDESGARLEAPAGLRVTRTSDAPSRRRERRLEEHRERVAQLRARLGDPDQALEQFLASSFDADALRSVAGDFAAERLNHLDTASDDGLLDADEW